MTPDLKTLLGIYPRIDEIEKTEEYRKRLSIEKEKIKQEFKPIYAAAIIVYKKLCHRPHYEDEAKEIYENLNNMKKEKEEKIEEKVRIKSEIACNQRKVKEINEFLEGKGKIIGNFRELKYYVYPVRPYDESYDYDIPISTFSQAQYRIVDEKCLRLSFMGDIVPIEKTPILRINGIALEEIRIPDYVISPQDYQNHLKEIDLKLIHCSKRGAVHYNEEYGEFGVITGISIPEFWSGKELINFEDKKFRAKNDKDNSCVPEIESLVRNVSMAQRQTNYTITERSKYSYDKKTGVYSYYKEEQGSGK